jgi:hypothetical protein
MLNKLVLILSFVLIFAVGTFTNCLAQTSQKENQSKNGVDVQERNTAAIEGKVESLAPVYEVKEKSVESLQALPMPEIWIVFEANDNLSADLPQEALTLLNSYWKETIKLRYKLNVEKPKAGREAQNKTAAIFNLATKTKALLEQNQISAPNEKRVISAAEAREIIRTLSYAADDLITTAENL